MYVYIYIYILTYIGDAISCQRYDQPGNSFYPVNSPEVSSMYYKKVTS